MGEVGRLGRLRLALLAGPVVALLALGGAAAQARPEAQTISAFGVTWLADADLARKMTFGVSGIDADGSMDYETAVARQAADLHCGGDRQARWRAGHGGADRDAPPEQRDPVVRQRHVERAGSGHAAAREREAAGDVVDLVAAGRGRRERGVVGDGAAR